MQNKAICAVSCAVRLANYFTLTARREAPQGDVNTSFLAPHRDLTRICETASYLKEHNIAGDALVPLHSQPKWSYAAIRNYVGHEEVPLMLPFTTDLSKCSLFFYLQVELDDQNRYYRPFELVAMCVASLIIPQILGMGLFWGTLANLFITEAALNNSGLIKAGFDKLCEVSGAKTPLTIALSKCDQQTLKETLEYLIKGMAKNGSYFAKNTHFEQCPSKIEKDNDDLVHFYNAISSYYRGRGWDTSCDITVANSRVVSPAKRK